MPRRQKGMASDDTIAAIATAAGRAGIGIVRVSGRSLSEFASVLLGRVPQPRRATVADFRDAAGALIDQGIALYFPAPRSYTGEDVLELQAHGGDAVLELLLERCIGLGARVAEPGEFTKRAYLNDKLDLAQAESVADLIEAATGSAAKSAARTLSGEFSRRIGDLVEGLIHLRTEVEATLDFPDEEVEHVEFAGTPAKLAALAQRLDRVLEAARQGQLLRSGLAVALVGRPNVGKSSLLNRLAGADVAIVTAVPGTTRDPVRESIQIEGVPLHIVDTAGLRPTVEPVERIGIERAWTAVAQADLVLFVLEAPLGVTEEDAAIERNLAAQTQVIRVFNKVDLMGEHSHVPREHPSRTVFVSAVTGAGLNLLRREMLVVAGWKSVGEGAFMARTRHIAALNAARQHIQLAGTRGRQPELLAEELRLAQIALTAITGEFTPDDLLGEIFSRFCIGK
jgi:tRNA modification GTPase